MRCITHLYVSTRPSNLINMVTFDNKDLCLYKNILLTITTDRDRNVKGKNVGCDS